jgi:hypothetical protein
MSSIQPRSAWLRRVGALAAASLVLVVLSSTSLAQFEGCYISGYDPDPYDSGSQPIYECPNPNVRHPPEFTGTWFAALAKSKGSYAWGASWHHSSRQAAERAALAECAKRGRTDCTIMTADANNCLSLAESVPDGVWGYATSFYDRSDAVSKATRNCRAAGGKHCRVVVSPCGRNNPATPPCIKEYRIDISRGEAWKTMTPQEKALWNRKANGACN